MVTTSKVFFAQKLEATMSFKQPTGPFPRIKEHDNGSYTIERNHGLFCFNSYPINPSKNKTPLKHVNSKYGWIIDPKSLLNEAAFYDEFITMFI